MTGLYTTQYPPPDKAPPAAAVLGMGWEVAVTMWHAHAPEATDGAQYCQVCRVPSPCEMWLWLGRFLSAAAGESESGQGEPLPRLPVAPKPGGLRYEGCAVGRAVPSAPVEARRRVDLPATYSDDRGWFG
jgi:hypothetical protein